MDDIRTEVVNGKYTDEENSDAFSEFQGTVIWPRRSLLYRTAFIALVPLFAVFLLGFSSPFWMKKHQVEKYRGHYNLFDKVDVSIGLWRVCEGKDFFDIKDCTSLPNITSYEMACQSMMCLSLIFTLFSLIFGFYENCATMYDIEDGNEGKTKWPEMNAIAAGIFGMIGVGMYGAIIIELAKGGDGAVHWAFPVTTISATGFIVCGILMAIANPIHAPRQNYPGQIMSLSRQSSLRVREPSVQDRLVSTSETAGQYSGAPAPSTLYGVMGGGKEPRGAPFLQRSDSCLSSHMSSPDLFLASTNAESNHYGGHRSTHVVETHDCYSRTYDVSRRSNVKLQNKAAQRRSWHFDDRSGAYVVSDLINRPCDATPSGDKRDVIKPPVPPRRDKNTSPSHPLPSRPSKSKALNSIPDESSDLMVLDDPVVIAPTSPGRNLNQDNKSDEQTSSSSRNTNPFIDDPPSSSSLSGSASHPRPRLQHSSVSTESWESQPWPDPPTEMEILGNTSPSCNTETSSVSNTPQPVTPQPVTPQTSTPQPNSVPESLQYQPQNYASLSRKQTQEDKKSPFIKSDNSESNSVRLKQGERTHRSGDTTPTKHKQGERIHRPSRSGSTKSRQESHVPVLQEYDNPLFKSQTPEDRRGLAFEQEFDLKICDSTSFIHPSPTPPPSYFSIVDAVQAEPTSYRRHSSHYSYSPKLDPRGSPHTVPRPASLENGKDPPPAYTRHPKGNKGDNSKKQATGNKGDNSKKQATPRDKGKHQQNGGVRSRPRQVKREHNQRRNAQQEGPHPQPPSPHAGSYGSSPDLTTRSPKPGRRMASSSGLANGNVYVQEDCNRNMAPRTPPPPDCRPSSYGYDCNRQSPYFIRPTNQFPHWGDSDL